MSIIKKLLKLALIFNLIYPIQAFSQQQYKKPKKVKIEQILIEPDTIKQDTTKEIIILNQNKQEKKNYIISNANKSWNSYGFNFFSQTKIPYFNFLPYINYSRNYNNFKKSEIEIGAAISNSILSISGFFNQNKAKDGNRVIDINEEIGQGHYKTQTNYWNWNQEESGLTNFLGAIFNFSSKNINTGFQLNIERNEKILNDLTDELNIEESTDTTLQGNVQVITQQTTKTKTKVNTSNDLVNLLFNIGTIVGSKFDWYGEHDIKAYITNIINESDNNFKQSINNYVDVSGYTIINTGTSIDTFPFSYNNYNSENLEKIVKEKENYVDIGLIYDYNSKNEDGAINFIGSLNKLIGDNKFGEGWEGIGYVGLSSKKLNQIAYFLEEYNDHKNNISIWFNFFNKEENFEDKVNKFNKLNKEKIELEQNYGLPSKIKKEIKEIKDLDLYKIEGWKLSGGVNYDKLKEKRVSGYISGGWSNGTMAFYGEAGNKQGKALIIYKNVGIKGEYEKEDYKDKKDEKYKVGFFINY